MRARRPEPQRVRRVVAVADDERVVGQADDRWRVDPVGAQAAVAIVLEHDAPAEAHGLRVLVARQLPGVAELQPVVVLLDLAAAVDLLLEHAEVVADAVADGGQLQRGERVHEAGREPAEAAVAEAGIALALQDLAEIEAVVGRQRQRRFVEVHVHQAEAEAAPGQELRRQVADALHVALDVRALRGQPAVDQPIADGVRERVIEVERRGVADLLRAGVDDVLDDRGAKVGVGEAGSATRAGRVDRADRLAVGSPSVRSPSLVLSSPSRGLRCFVLVDAGGSNGDGHVRMRPRCGRDEVSTASDFR